MIVHIVRLFESCVPGLAGAATIGEFVLAKVGGTEGSTPEFATTYGSVSSVPVPLITVELIVSK